MIDIGYDEYCDLLNMPPLDPDKDAARYRVKFYGAAVDEGGGWIVEVERIDGEQTPEDNG